MDLHDACENGNKYLIKKKLDQKIWKVTDRDETGRTGLHAACFGAQLDVVKLLFGYKVHMDVGDGDRPKKKKKKQKVEIQYMGSNQSSNNITYDDLSEPVCLGQDLKTGVENNALRDEIMVQKSMLANGDKAYQDIYGNTPLLTVCFIGSKQKEDTKIVDILLENGDLVNRWCGTDKMTPLCWAAYHGDIEIVKRLLAKGANPVWQNKPGCQFAIDLCGTRAMLRSTEGLKDDIEMESTKNVRTNFGNPKECCRILLKYGVDHLGKEHKNDMFESGHYAELNSSLIDTYRQHLLYWSAYLDEIEHCRSIFEAVRNEVGKVVKWKSELKVIKAVVHLGQLAPSGKSPLGHSNATGTGIHSNSESLSAETRIDIKRNEQTLDNLDCSFDLGGGLVLKPTVENDAKSKGAVVAHVNELSSCGSLETSNGNLEMGYHLVQIGGKADLDILKMCYTDIVNTLDRIKSTLLNKNVDLRREKRELPGIELHFCPPEALASILHGQNNENQRQSKSCIDPLTVCYPWNQNAYAETPLHVACRYGNPDIVKLMLQFIPANEKSMMAEKRSWKNFNGDTPIHLAVLKNHATCAKHLIETGLTLGSTNSMGWKEWDLCDSHFGSDTPIDLALVRTRMNTNKKENRNVMEHTTTLNKLFLREIRSQRTSSKCDFVLVFGDDNYQQCKYLYEAFKNRSEETLGIALGCNPITEPPQEQYVSCGSHFHWPGVKKDDGFFSSWFKFLSQRKKRIFMKIYCSDGDLNAWAQEMNFKHKVRGETQYRFFNADESEKFEPFRSRHRQAIILDILKRTFDKDRYLRQKVMKGFFATHSERGRHLLLENYFHNAASWPPIGRLMLWLQEGKHINYHSLNFVRVYFGQKYAMFFAWLEFTTTWMIVGLAIPGLVFHIINAIMHIDFILIFFSLYVVLWFSLMTDKWKRKRRELLEAWNVETGEVDDYTRPEFYGDVLLPVQQNRFTDGKTEKVYPEFKRTLTKIAGTLILLLCVGAVVGIFVSIRLIDTSDYLNDIAAERPYIRQGLGALQGFMITVMNVIYSTMARKFTMLENHEKDSDFEFNLAMKTFIFQFVNSYLSLFYYIYVADLEKLQSALISLLISKQLSDFVQIIVIPHFRFRFRLWRRGLLKTFQKMQRGNDNDIQKANSHKVTEIESNSHTKGTTRNETDNVEIQKPIEEDNERKSRSQALRELIQRRKRQMRKPKGLATSTRYEPKNEVLAVQEAMIPPKPLVSTYIQLIIQLGYCTMFAVVLPIAGAIISMFNVFIIRFRMYSMVHDTQRPTDTLNTNDVPGEYSSLVSMITGIQEFMSYFSIAMNCLLIWVFHRDSLGEQFQLDTEISQLFFILIAENCLIFIKLNFQKFLPEVPEWVVNSRQTEFAEEDRRILRERDAEYSSHSPNKPNFQKDPVTPTKAKPMHHRPDQLPPLIQGEDNMLHESKNVERVSSFPDNNLPAPTNSNYRKTPLLHSENKMNQKIHAQKARRYEVQVDKKQQEEKIRPTQGHATKVPKSFFFGHLDTETGGTSNNHGNNTFSRGSRFTRRRRGRKVAPAT